MGAMLIDADLGFDPNEVGPDCVVECWISQGPRSQDPLFDPQPGDPVRLVDADGEHLRARVIAREGNIVTVQVTIPGLTAQSA